jgi:hypothetical protein
MNRKRDDFEEKNRVNYSLESLTKRIKSPLSTCGQDHLNTYDDDIVLLNQQSSICSVDADACVKNDELELTVTSDLLLQVNKCIWQISEMQHVNIIQYSYSHFCCLSLIANMLELTNIELKEY